MESKSEKFHRLAEARTNRILDHITSLSKLANMAHYEFSQEDVREIFGAIRKELNSANTVFEKALEKTRKNRFRLGESEG